MHGKQNAVLRYTMPARILPTELQRKAEKELNEVPSKTKENLEYIREWLTKQPHLKARTDDQWLLAFLRGCKFSLQATKEKLDLFYTMRTVAPELFINRDPFLFDIQEFYNRGILVQMTKPVCSTGSVVVLARTKFADPNIITITQGIKAISMLFDFMLMENDNFAVSGQQLLVDLEDTPYKYITLVTPAIVKKCVIFLQKAYPMRPQGVHFINIPSYVEPILRLIRSLASGKLDNRIHVYTKKNLKDVYDTIPLSVLPKEYGGDGGSIQEMIAQTKANIEKYKEWFREDFCYRSDESKRIGKPQISSEMFGMEGSFRKLEID